MRSPLVILGFSVYMALSVVGAAAQTGDVQVSADNDNNDPPTLRIGVRYDAPPFSYSDKHLIALKAERSDQSQSDEGGSDADVSPEAEGDISSVADANVSSDADADLSPSADADGSSDANADLPSDPDGDVSSNAETDPPTETAADMASGNDVEVLVVAEADMPHFRGYVVEICRDIWRGLRDQPSLPDFKIELVEVSAQTRFEYLRNGQIDILCDPATITRERLDRDDENSPLMSSLPIYMSAVTFAELRSGAGTHGCKSIVGVVSETTAQAAGVGAIISSGHWAKHAGDIRRVLISGEYDDRVSERCDGTNGGQGYIIQQYDTHDKLASDFCNGLTEYYVGDIEIIRSMIVRAGCESEMRIAPAQFTVERYGIYARQPTDDPEKSLLIFAFLAELTRQVLNEEQSILIRVFEDEFLSGKNLYPASTTLQTFFWSMTGAVPRAP